MADLRGRAVLVTGGGTRVGAVICSALAQAGAKVLVHYNSSQSEAGQVVSGISALGGEAHAEPADLTRREECQSLIDRTVTRFGRIDLLVCSAANFERVEFEAVTPENFSSAFSLNLLSAFYLTQYAAPTLKQHSGSVIFITCSSATTPFRHYLPYVVSKGALTHLMRTLALELAPEVRVNAVAPGTVLPPPSMPQAAKERLATSVPLRRLGAPQDIAQAVLYLAQAEFVTGQEIQVDGGRNLAKIEHFG